MEALNDDPEHTSVSSRTAVMCLFGLTNNNVCKYAVIFVFFCCLHLFFEFHFAIVKLNSVNKIND